VSGAQKGEGEVGGPCCAEEEANGKEGQGVVHEGWDGHLQHRKPKQGREYWEFGLIFSKRKKDKKII